MHIYTTCTARAIKYLSSWSSKKSPEWIWWRIHWACNCTSIIFIDFQQQKAFFYKNWCDFEKKKLRNIVKNYIFTVSLILFWDPAQNTWSQLLSQFISPGEWLIESMSSSKSLLTISNKQPVEKKCIDNGDRGWVTLIMNSLSHLKQGHDIISTVASWFWKRYSFFRWRKWYLPPVNSTDKIFSDFC